MVSYLDGYDAVFLPGKIHGAEHQIYIIYYNPDADNGNGCFEIEVLDAERIVELYEYVDGDAENFFTLLPDWFQGKWYYCDRKCIDFKNYVECYNEADFIIGRDGGMGAELNLIVSSFC
ncbi:MAG: hypothetical protein E7523_00210 [Ruminococcaceae bacterium]|nr:hypothetical protein [Oscillospiraceae bacterium]